ncbi:MAG: DUF4166 domain-containing protein [Alphaproteobacteria bacterium]|nr:DUF4166 domain-containing protein [Alphaproteobacteria bacterium]
MSDLAEKGGVWFVYDGECPMCTSAAHALRIKKDYGTIHLVNAREAANDPLVHEINKRGLDLDDGMVIYVSDRFYHGKDALKFMARYGEASNAFTAFCKGVFWSSIISSLTYPWMRGTRNWLLGRKNAESIDNLNLKDAPTFKSIFGESWNSLPPVMKKHYANRPYTDDVTVVEGTLDVMCKQPLKFLASLMKFMGQIPAHNEKNVPVIVRFQSDKNTKAFHFNRTFNFKETKPYAFHSRMLQIQGNEVIEVMRFGLCWKMLYLWDGKKVVLKHRGYALRLLGHFIPVPLTVLMGEGYAEEIAVDDNTFDMITHITHPWWGKVYEYKGRFKIA